MTGGQNFIKNAKCTHGHRSAKSNSAWCDLNKNSVQVNRNPILDNELSKNIDR